jgi:myo-inositol-1(or 4)-monophosphatase|nr:inositol monophosphatase family protein [Candidatus Krumholzibacteria bacterium]
MSEQLAEELFVVQELVTAAGSMLLDSMGQVGPIATKRATELITDLDGRVEEFLLEGLQHHFPQDQFLAEESGEAAGSSGRTWYIDPLDGTTNYAHGYPFFSVSVACASDEKLLLGAVFAPYLDELYLAHDQGGAVVIRPRHGVSLPLEKRQPVQLQQALLATGFPYVRDELVDRNTGHVARFLKAKCHGVRRGGSAALDLVHVAAGKLDGYWEYSLRPWDSAAGTLIAREAGALVSDFSGQSRRLHFETILAAAPGLHEVMVDLLAAGGSDGTP